MLMRNGFFHGMKMFWTFPDFGAFLTGGFSRFTKARGSVSTAQLGFPGPSREVALTRAGTAAACSGCRRLWAREASCGRRGTLSGSVWWLEI